VLDHARTWLKNRLSRFGMRLWRASLGFNHHEGTLVAAGIAYYVALSIVPFLFLLVAGITFVLEGDVAGQDTKEEVFKFISGQVSANFADQVRQAYDAAKGAAPTGLTIGLLALVVTSIAIFVQVDYAFDRIWHLGTVRQETWLQWGMRHVVARFKALVMLLAVGAFLLAALIISTIWSGVQTFLAEHNVEPLISRLTGIGINVALNYFIFAFMYKFVPKPTIKWREAFAAGFVAAPLWEVGRQLLSIYFLRLNNSTAYGVIGSFMAIMLWAYYAMLVVLFGAEYVRVRQHERIEAPAVHG
jgi:membrane protein